MDNKEFKILSIDGGGIKGLYTANILAQLEEEYECSLSDHFDMICGTSTGGIIALALSLKIPASTILKFYREDGPKIFKYKGRIARSYAFFKQLLIESKYNKSRLRDALKKVLGDHIMGDSNNLLCIPSFNVSTGKNRVFKYDHSILRGDNNLKMVDVALATSAAPTYFPMHKMENAYYVDGGIWANNPSLVGLSEAMKFFVGEGKDFDSVRILSVSSLNHANGFHIAKKWFNTQDFERRSFRHWGGKLFQLTLDAQSEFVDYFLNDLIKNLARPGLLVTIPSHEISPDNVSSINLDMATKKSVDLLEVYGRQQGLKHRTQPEIKAFFDKPKLFKITKNV